MSDISHDDDGNLYGTIIPGGDPVISCRFTWTHDSGSPTRIDGTLDDSGNCVGGPIDGGITPGDWVIVLTVTYATGPATTADATGASVFTVSPPDTTPPDDTSTDTTVLDQPGTPVRIDANAALPECEKSAIAITDISRARRSRANLSSG